MGTRVDYSYILIREALFRLGKQNEWAIGEVTADDATATVTALIGAGDENLIVEASYGDIDSVDLQGGQMLWEKLIEQAASPKKAAKPEPEPDAEPEAAPTKAGGPVKASPKTKR